jgi:hypothetical protein
MLGEGGFFGEASLTGQGLRMGLCNRALFEQKGASSFWARSQILLMTSRGCSCFRAWVLCYFWQVSLTMVKSVTVI